MLTTSECIALALERAGAEAVTCIPSFGANAVFSDYCDLKNQRQNVSFHPEAAFGIALGASLLGKRAATLLKAHGFLKAGNSVIDALYTGVNGGLVIFIFDDKEGRQSDSIVDITPVLSAMGLPYQVLGPSDRDLYRRILDGFARSEQLQLPYVLVFEAGDMEKEVLEDIPPPAEEARSGAENSYHRDITRYVLCPLFTRYQYRNLQFRMGRDATRPTPPAVPAIPGSLPEKWHPVIRQYSLLFSAFQEIRGEVVTGDVGVSSFFAFPPYHCIDITTYMGGSIPVAAGAFLAGCQEVWAITGDYAFISAGHLGLLEAWQRKIPLKILLLNNEKSETTGGQTIAPGTLDMILEGYKPYVRRLTHPQDPTAVTSILHEASLAKELRIVVADFTA
ncbi:MAG TPA: thiamine pyrophosphate-dependent enzyme [Syntrophomonas sp.]|nr:thiamine pyrophosphate-dependent enzyme [Syntrophomonas sp.]